MSHSLFPLASFPEFTDPRLNARIHYLHLVAILALTFLVVALCVPSASAQTFEPYSFEVEITKAVEARRGQIMVPEDRSAPESRQIPIRFVVLESRAENPGAPIMYLAGGPGGAGTSAMRGERWKMFDRLRDIADVVILDQRGTGMSNEVPECTSSVELAPSGVAATRERYASAYRQAMQECLGFWENEGVAIRGYTTRENAADIDAVREALGAERLNLLGISYGTHLALATLKRYPERIGRLVLASPEGLSQTVKLPARTDAYFERLQAAIDADPETKERYPDVRGLIEDVLSRIETETPTIRVPEGQNNPAFERTLSRFDAQLALGYMISDPGDNLAWTLGGLHEATEGNYGWFRSFFDYTYDGPTISLGGMSEAMDIASGISPERLVRIEAQAETALLGDALNFPMPHLRGAIPGIDLGEDFRAPIRSGRPALILSGTLDGRTYPEAHAEIAGHLTSSATVTIENVGHNLFFSHPRVVDLVAAFFDGSAVESQTLAAPPPSLTNRGLLE